MKIVHEVQDKPTTQQQQQNIQIDCQQQPKNNVESKYLVASSACNLAILQ